MSNLKSKRDHCAMCGDKLFKIIDRKILCRKGHVVGLYQALATKQEKPKEESDVVQKKQDR